MKQHYIPNFYLKYFSDTNGKVCTYDKQLQKHWLKPSSETACQTHYYSFEDKDGKKDIRLEKVFSQIEGEAAPIHQKLSNGLKLNLSEKESYSYFLALMYLRTPQIRHSISEIVGKLYEQQIFFTAKHERAFKNFLNQIELSGCDISDEQYIKDQLLDLSNNSITIPKHFALQIFDKIVPIARLFLKMKWSYAKAKNHFFVTCDSPMTIQSDQKTNNPNLVNRGLYNTTSIFTFPINNKRLLFMHREIELFDNFVLDRDIVWNENLERFYNAESNKYIHTCTIKKYLKN